MAPLGVPRNYVIMVGDKSLKVTLGILHSFYIWDSKAVFLVVVGNLSKQKRIIIEDFENDMHFNKTTPYVLVEHIFRNSNAEPVTEVSKN